MKDFIRQRLIEAIKSRHWEKDSYPNRILQSTFEDLGPEAKAVVDGKIKFLEELEFGDAGDKIGVWLYKAPTEIKHPPFKRRDKGSLLLAIMNDNTMTTLYWKHKREGEYDFDINIDELIEMSKTEFYDAQNKPITIKTIKSWKESMRPKVTKKERFKKIKLSNGQVIRYYDSSNRFETLDGQPLNVDDIFDSLPEDLQNKVMELMESIELPVEIGDTVLMGKFKNKKVVVKDIDWDEEKGDLKINGKPALKMRIIKKLDDKK